MADAKPAPPAVDVSKLSDQERAFYEKFGKLPKPKASPLAKKEKVVFDSAEFFMNNKPGAGPAPLQAKPKNPLLPGQRKAPPPRVHVTTNTTENTWIDETDEVVPDSPAHDSQLVAREASAGKDA